MPCYRPLLGHRDGMTVNGKPHYRITSMVDSALEDFSEKEVVQIPCGKCLGCRLQYAQDWSNRLLMEMKCHDSSYFITMTYDDDHVPRILYDDTMWLENLSIRDVQLFIKKLRKYSGEKIRYFITGEYGDDTFRPHYHGIIFGLHLEDLKDTGHKSYSGDPILESEWLNKVWSKGFIQVGTVTAGSTGYVARYVTKKVNNDQRDLQIERGQQPEFALMSRKPAIGRGFYDENPDMFDNISYHMCTEKGPVNIFPSRYFRNLIDSEQSKAKRLAVGKIKRNSKLAFTNLSYSDMLDTELKNKKDQIKVFHRNSI